MHAAIQRLVAPFRLMCCLVRCPTCACNAQCTLAAVLQQCRATVIATHVAAMCSTVASKERNFGAPLCCHVASTNRVW